MPRKKRISGSPDPTPLPRYATAADAQWGGFINIKVDDSWKLRFDDWFTTHRHECLAALDDLLGEGMKVAFSYDHENECYIVSFTGKGWEGSKLRWCMTSRAGTFDEALGLATFKHFVMADRDWGAYKPDGTKKMQWG